ncbi:hypothetical protein [Rhodoplanes sp. Z2-YC6860]|uniref:hypothetical protein n=1 Tax=Rhodoplanes sp. Z2-YC6860 TaxID=674703 RepID=UPI0012ED047C|nr:hypothetical protein [Rhodoplanes sp. Z2-YC6860]
MMFRAIVSCVALVLGLLAALDVTAQSAGACNGASCSSTQPLNLMNFVNGSGKAGTAKAAAPAATASAKKTATKHRHPVKTATRASEDAVAPSPEQQPALPTAASADTEHSEGDVQVVSGDEVNAIDLAMSKSDKPPAETNGTAPGAENDNPDRAKWADANEFRTEQYKPSSAPAPAPDTTNSTAFRDDTWMGRFWSVIGDGYVALMAMIKQLFS